MIKHWANININDTIRFRLTSDGEKLWQAYWAGGLVDTKHDFLRHIPADKDGWREEQLWRVMQVMGLHLGKGVLGPMETGIQVEVKVQVK